MIGLFVTGRAIRNDNARVAVGRSVHSERLENSSAEKRPIVAAANVFDNKTEQIETRVAIFPRDARLKFHRLLADLANELGLSWMSRQLETLEAGVTFQA